MLGRNAGLSAAAFSTRESDWNCHERCGGEMPLDALDQKTLSSLPRLSDVHDSYGVEVNALSVSEILSAPVFFIPTKLPAFFRTSNK